MKLIPFFLLSVLITAAFIIGAAVIFCVVMDENALFPKASAAIVMGSEAPEDLTDEAIETLQNSSGTDLKTKMMITLVSQMPSVKSICNFSFMKSDEAARALRDGTVDVAIYLPPGTYESINTGENRPVTLLLSDRAQALQKDLFTELVAAGVSLIQTVESAVYSVDYLAYEQPLTINLGDAEDRIFSVYVYAALNRANVFRLNSTSAFGNLTMKQFYLASGTLLIILLFGIGFGTFYTSSEKQVCRMISRFGIPETLLSTAKLIAMTVILTLMMLIVLIAVRFGVPAISAAILEGGSSTVLPGVSDILGTLPGLIAGAAAIAFSSAALIHLVYTFTEGRDGNLLYLLIITALFCICGGLLPVSWMPSALRSIIPRTPVSIWQNALAALLFESTDAVMPALKSILWGVILLVPTGLRRYCSSDAFYRRHSKGGAR